MLAGLLLLAPLTHAQVALSVNTTADMPDVAINGVCDADDTMPGEQCTLRAAIQEAEATPAADSIHFDIPGTDVHTISVGTVLPTLFQPVVIDGYTQPGASPNTNGPDEGTNAVIKIALDGGDTVGSGVVICLGLTTVRGLAVGGFTGVGIHIACHPSGPPGHTVEGCFVGTDASGTVARPNGGEGVSINNGSGNRVGGATPAARNVLSGNGRFGVGIGSGGSGQASTDNVIQGNLIGTDASGTVAIPNGTAFPGQLGGVGVTPNQGSVSNTVIGGPTPAARNVIAGNVGAGVLLQGSAVGDAGLRVEGNFIGTDVTGALPLPNAGVGVSVSSSITTIGGTAAGTGNRIAHNGSAGVSIPGLNTGVRVLGNAISDNGGLGMDLAFLDGIPLANDPGDPDGGVNRQQNTPVLAAVSLIGAGTLAVTYAVDTETANATYPLRVEFFRADGGGEGEAFLGTDTYDETDFGGCGTPPCEKTATFAPAAPVASADAVVATATDEAGNTGEFTADAAIVVAREGDAPGVSAAATLHAPVPNPSPGSARLAFALVRPGRVRVAVYDLLGREVAVLVDGERAAGLHEVMLSAEGLAAGTYVVRLQAGASTVSRRVVIAR